MKPATNRPHLPCYRLIESPYIVGIHRNQIPGI